MGNSVNKFLFIFVRKMRNYIRVSFFPKSEILLDNFVTGFRTIALSRLSVSNQMSVRSISFRFSSSHPVEIQQETC